MNSISRLLLRPLARLHWAWRGVRRHALMRIDRTLFGSHGKNFRFDPDGLYTYANIHVGDDVSLGVQPTLLASASKIRIGKKVIFGPKVTMIGGDHNIAEVGQFIHDVKKKRPGDDLDIVIEDDVWVGTGAIILKGVTIGRGSVIAAGAVVTKSIPPYSIAAGVPARVKKVRWDTETILIHEAALYPADQRLSRELIQSLQPN